MKVPSRHRLPSVPGPRLPRHAAAGRGFGLVEIIVVVAIIGFAALIAGSYFSALYKKQQLATTAGDIRTFLHDAGTQMQNRNLRVFVQVSQLTGPPARWHFEMIEDTTNDAAISLYDPEVGKRVSGKDTLLRVYDAPAPISLSGTNADQINSAFWSGSNPKDATPRWIGIDFQKRAFNSSGGAQIGGIAVLSVSHVDMVAGSLAPLIVYQVHVNPVWDVTVRRG